MPSNDYNIPVCMLAVWTGRVTSSRVWLGMGDLCGL